MNVISNIFKVLAWPVYAVIIAALLLAAPMVVGYRPVVVLSPSMEPGFPVGSVTYYKAASFAEIAVGDPITFEIGAGSLATHRVVEVDTANQTFVTKGDNNPSNDPSPVEYSRVVGKTTEFAIPYAGYFSTYMQNTAVIVVMGVVMLISIFLPGSKKRKQKEDFGGSEHVADQAPMMKLYSPVSTEDRQW